MIPTTITGIVLFLALLLPGFLFITLRERHRPTRKLSALRETGTVLAATSAAYVPIAVLVVVLAVFVPSFRSELAAFLSGPGAYAAAHPFRLALAAVATVAAATVVSGSLLSAPRASRFIPSSGGSAWWSLFDIDGKVPQEVKVESIEVTATLLDGTTIVGTLHSWSRDGDDHPDRALVLQAPLWQQGPKAHEFSQLDAATLTVTAGQIKYLTARYIGSDDQPT